MKYIRYVVAGLAILVGVGIPILKVIKIFFPIPSIEDEVIPTAILFVLGALTAYVLSRVEEIFENGNKIFEELNKQTQNMTETVKVLLENGQKALEMLSEYSPYSFDLIIGEDKWTQTMINITLNSEEVYTVMPTGRRPQALGKQMREYYDAIHNNIKENKIKNFQRIILIGGNTANERDRVKWLLEVILTLADAENFSLAIIYNADVDSPVSTPFHICRNLEGKYETIFNDCILPSGFVNAFQTNDPDFADALIRRHHMGWGLAYKLKERNSFDFGNIADLAQKFSLKEDEDYKQLIKKVRGSNHLLELTNTVNYPPYE